MTGFDIAVLVIVALGAITGLMRGFVQEILALAAWFLSIFAIHTLHTPFTAALLGFVGTESGAAVLAFAILLLIPYAIMKLVANRMGEASRNSVLGPIDRVLGLGFGGIKGVLIAVIAFSVLLLGYDTVWGPGGRPNWITQARTYPFMNAGSEAMVDMIAKRRQAAREAEEKATKQRKKSQGE